MRFDFIPFFNPGENIPFHQTISMMRDQTALAQEAGFSTVWVTEHHFAHDGYLNAAPNSILMCSDLAAHYDAMRVGMAPVVLPDKHPLRVAEDVALLDNLTAGRVEFGVGRGNNERSCIQFDVRADPRNDQQNYAIFMEAIDVIIAAMTEDPFRFDGDYYRFPEPGWHEKNTFCQPYDQRYYAEDGEYIAMGVHPKPYQQPHPPIWLASDKLRAYEYAAGRGFNVLCNTGPRKNIRAGWEAYRTIASATHGRELALGEGVGLSQMIYVGTSMEHAAETVRPAINKYWGFLSGARAGGEWSRKWMLADDVEFTLEDEQADWFDFLQKHQLIWVGDADYVSSMLELYQAEIGLRHILFLQQFPGVAFSDIIGGMDRFAADVMPRFQ